MNFQKDHIYHIYNQGNNQREVFFERRNYLFFLEKVKTHIVPYSDILAWCLMPNHFHFMVLVREVEISIDSHPMTWSHRMTSTKRTLNQSIAIMLRSYTRAINKHKNISGSLFRQKTKAECITCPEGISPSWYVENGITTYINTLPEDDYPQVCFNYIHENPVKSGLVKRIIDWEFSSARDYADIRNGKLVNKKIAIECGLV